MARVVRMPEMPADVPLCVGISLLSEALAAPSIALPPVNLALLAATVVLGGIAAFSSPNGVWEMKRTNFPIYPSENLCYNC